MPNDVETWKGSLTRIRHIYQPGFRNPQPLRRDASKREAEELNARLAKIENLSDRIAEDAPVGRGTHRLLDQPRSRRSGDPPCHRRVWRRHRHVHPRYRTPVPRGAGDRRAFRDPLRPAHPPGDAGSLRGRGARRPRRRVRLPPFGRQPQGLLRGAQGAPAEPRACKARKAGSPACAASIPRTAPMSSLPPGTRSGG